MLDNKAKFGMLVIAVLGGCERAPSTAVAAPPSDKRTIYRLASAPEIFELRSQCAALGRKKVEDDIHGPALSVTGSSRYNTQTNRCYVELNSNGVDDPMRQSLHYLYDAQTDELLAYVGIEKGKQVGQIFVARPITDPLQRTESGFEQAGDYINEVMQDDRIS